MSKNIFFILFISLFLSSCSPIRKGETMVTPLQKPPATIEKYHEIALKYPEKIHARYNQLTPQERVFIYYLYRASLPGNHIAAEQRHRDATTLRDIFHFIIKNKEKILTAQRVNHFDAALFIEQAEQYLVYLWANHSQYFAKENVNEKRTPQKLHLALITQENLTAILTLLDYPEAHKTVATIARSLFDASYEPTLTITNNIQNSAINFYEHGFTDEDYETVSETERTKINNYFFIKQENGKRVIQTVAASTSGHHSQALQISSFWLEKAIAHAQNYPKMFDPHLVKSLKLLLEFFKTGDEQKFKEHSIEWVQSSSRIDYCLGFIETYQDPKGIRGTFQGEATIKQVDLASLKPLLSKLEQNLPLAPAFKRTNLNGSTCPAMNASINAKIFGTGDLGPLCITAAYCLPNYDDIRAHYGSKQIIYPSAPSLAVLLNPTGYQKLFFTQDRAAWFAQHDPQCSLVDDLADLRCILHESIGHGSGRTSIHTFKPGDPLKINGTTYKIGQTIPVTNENSAELLGGYESTIEELRAEIIAFYSTITALEDLIKHGFFKKWTTLLSPQELCEWNIFFMAMEGFKRMLSQPDQAQEMTGDHARADWTITTYLHEHHCFDIVQETVAFDDKKYTVFSIKNIALDTTIETAKKLMQLTQQIKSTADGQGAKHLIQTYGVPIKNPAYVQTIKENYQALVGDLKVCGHLSPIFTPVTDPKTGDLLDIQARWPKNIFELIDHTWDLEMSKDV